MSPIAAHLQRTVAAGHLSGVVAGYSEPNGVTHTWSAGRRKADDPAPMTHDTVFAIYSMTKAVTGAAAMQLVEHGKIGLDQPAGEIIDYLGRAKVLDGFEPDGSPKLRDARLPVTLRNLLTHTSGFGYDIWSSDLARYAEVTGALPLGSMKRSVLETPLAFDPGERWLYGIGIDWVGLLIEAITGRTLGSYCAEHLFEPLGMNSTAFAPTPAMASRLASIHLRTDDGLVPFALPAPTDPEFEMGGGGLFSTVGDYLQFTQMIVNDGVGNGHRVLRQDTVGEMSRNQMGHVRVEPLTSTNPMLSNDVEWFKGVDKTWGLSFLINESETAAGRPAGSLAWAGLANTYFWIDRERKVTGVFAGQLFPFNDAAAFDAFLGFEAAVNQMLAAP